MPYSRLGRLTLLLLAAPLARAETAPAGRTVHGAHFAPDVQVGSERLTLRGAGTLRYKRIISVYAAAFYTAPDSGAADPLGDVPKRLEVEYLVSAKSRDFSERGDEILKNTLTPAELTDIQPRLREISGWYPDPNPGDRCAITYVPGHGTELFYNGRVLGVIPGEDFQRAYFSIWFGAQPASRSLRDDLLGGGPPQSRKSHPEIDLAP